MVYLEYRDETGEAYLSVSSQESLDACMVWLKSMQAEALKKGKESFSEFKFWEEGKDVDK